MGSDVFLHRIEALYDQTLQVETAIDRVLQPAGSSLFVIFEILDSYSEQLKKLI